jgi:hypothetical protein
MNIDPLHEAPISIHGTGIGTVSPDMVRKRAEELAVINGREAYDASMSDWDEALRELTCGEEFDAQQTLMESLPESERWDPIPGSPSHEAVTVFGDNEDADGRSVGERLCAEGVAEAAHDQMLAAAAKSSSEGN